MLIINKEIYFIINKLYKQLRHRDCWLPPATSNSDLKKNYVPVDAQNDPWGWWNDVRVFAFSIHAYNYPITVNVDRISKWEFPFPFPDWNLTISLHNEEGALKADKYYGGWGDIVSWEIPDQNYFGFDIHNGFLGVTMGYHISIENDILPHKFIYPNPASDTVKLEGCNFGSKYQIVDSAGIVVKTGIIDNENCIIDISNLPASTYYIKTDNISYKFIKSAR